MRGRRRYLMFLPFLAVFGVGCATIIQGTTQEIPVSSSPSGATVIVDGGPRFKTPSSLVLSRKEAHKIEISLEGYYPEVIELRSVTSGAVAGNILLGGLVGWAVDNTSGGQFRLVPDVVHVDLRRIAPDSQKPLQQPQETSR